MGRRNDHSKAELHQLILTAAIEIANDEGLQGLSTRKIAKSINYTVGSLYQVFQNLDDLVLHVNAETLNQLYQVMQQRELHHDNKKQQLINMAHAYRNFAEKNPNRWRMIFEYIRPQDPVIPPWYQQRIERLFCLVEQPIGQLLNCNDQQQCEQQARALWSGVHGICSLGMTGKLALVGTQSTQALLNQFLQTYLAGLNHPH